MTHFTFAAFTKTSELFSWIHSLSADSELIECGQLHRGSHTAFIKSTSPIPRPIICTDFFTCEGSGDRFSKAYHKQNAIPVTHGLLIYECETLSEMCATILTNPEFKDFQLLEVSRNALPNGFASAIFVNVDQFKYPAKFSGAYISELNPQLRTLF